MKTFLFVISLTVTIYWLAQNTKRYMKLKAAHAKTIRNKNLFEHVKNMNIGEGHREVVTDFRFKKIQGIHFFIDVYEDHTEIVYASFFYDDFVYELKEKGEKMVEIAKQKIEAQLKENPSPRIQKNLNAGTYRIDVSSEWIGRFNYV